jgi:hypothetical protein
MTAMMMVSARRFTDDPSAATADACDGLPDREESESEDDIQLYFRKDVFVWATTQINKLLLLILSTTWPLQIRHYTFAAFARSGECSSLALAVKIANAATANARMLGI